MDIEKHVTQVLADAAAFEPKIGDNETYAAAGKALKTVSATIKEVEKHYEDDKARAYDIYKGVLADIKALTDPLSTSKAKIKKAMDAYSREQDQKARELAAKMLDEATDAMPLEVSVEKPAVAGVTEVTYWGWKLKDVTKVPAEYLIVDEKKVGALVRDLKESAQAILGEGIEVYSEKRTRG